MTTDEVRAVVRLLRTTRLTYLEIGRRVGVCENTVAHIRLGRWHVGVTGGRVPRPPSAGRSRGNRKLTDEHVVEMRRLRREGVVYRELAARFGVGLTTVREVCGFERFPLVGGVQR